MLKQHVKKDYRKLARLELERRGLLPGIAANSEKRIESNPDPGQPTENQESDV